MGIVAATALLILEEGKRRAYRGKILQLGRQDIWFIGNGLKSLVEQVGFTLHTPQSGSIDPDQRVKDVDFFQALGFSDVLSMECGAEEAVDYNFDLNNVVPAEWHEQFDAIYDGGTCEHIFKMPNCMVLPQQSLWSRHVVLRA